MASSRGEETVFHRSFPGERDLPSWADRMAIRGMLMNP